MKTRKTIINETNNDLAKKHESIQKKTKNP